MRPRSRLAEIQRLDPVTDHQRIVHLIACYEFPWDMTRSLEMAPFRTFCVPSIAALLDRTGEFNHRTQKRYDDTDIIISELMEHGYEHERGSAAIRKMNQLHGRFNIANADFVYVLSTFLFEPIRWIDRFGWRRTCANERTALFHFWTRVGQCMGIREIPGSFEAFEDYKIDYEQRCFKHTEAAARIGAATVEMFTTWFPRVLAPLVRRGMVAVMDDPMIAGFGFPPPTRAMRGIVKHTLRARARLLRLLPVRRQPKRRTQEKHRSYPIGYQIDRLGPVAKPQQAVDTQTHKQDG